MHEMNSPSINNSETDSNKETTKRKFSPVAQAEDEHSASLVAGGNNHNTRPLQEEVLVQDKPMDTSSSETDQPLTNARPLDHQDKKHRSNHGDRVIEFEKGVISFNSTESLLAIPVRHILRQTSFQNKNPHILSRMEASLLLQINLISYELDALLQLSIEAIEKSHACKLFSRDIAETNNNIYLRPLFCLLHTHGKVIPQQVVQYVQNHLEVILGHFPAMIQSLRQCAEQNWSVSNTLLGMNMDGMEIDLLGKEKGILAEIEEEVCRRLESLMAICDEGGLLEGNVFEEESMELFCERKFGMDASTSDSNNPNKTGGGNNTQKTALPLAMQDRTKSINDAATALGMLASGGTSGFDQKEGI